MRMRAFGLLVLVLGLVQGAAAAGAEKRVALVIGNGAYDHVPPLRNPANDAGDMAAALSALGFEVIEGHDLDHGAMRSIVRRFSEALRNADVGLFFYAGHGMQVAGQNYLAPVDARLVHEADLDFSAVSLDLILRNMEREAKTSIVFLDACRDNPMARTLARTMGTRSGAVSSGLAQIQSGIGSYIAFATQPGNVALDGEGRNSPFTGALLKHIGAPDTSLGDMMIAVRNDVMSATGRTQVPWEHHSLTGQFYFNRSGTALAVARERDRPAPAEAPATRLAVLPPIVGRAGEPSPRAPLHECDRLAAFRPDAALGVEHVPFRAIDPGAAIPACESAVAERPDEHRFVFQLARALDAAREFGRAVQHYEALVDAGHAPAMNNLATLYENGHGVATDHAKAAEHYRLAVDLGHGGAMSNLGWMYANGRGLPQSVDEAARLYRMGVERDNASAMNNLGWAHAQGLGVAKDDAEAVRLYREATARGHARGATNLGYMYEHARGVRRNPAEAFKYYMLGAERGDSLAMNNVGWAYARGIGVAANAREAARWVALALAHRNEWSMRQMRTNSDAWGGPFRRALQALLKEDGVYEGAVDGSFGPATLSAIDDYVDRHGRSSDCRCES